MPVRTSAELKKQNDQPLRVYRDSSDKTGIVLCRPCRDTFYTLNPAASGAGEYGGQCEHCPREATGQAATGTHTQASSKAQRVSGHLAAGRDYEQARDLSRAHQHYQAALMLATEAERPAIEEAIDRVSGAPRYRYNSYEDYPKAYGFDSPDEYAKARATYNDEGTGHHPAICSGRCPCKAAKR